MSDNLNKERNALVSLYPRSKSWRQKVLTMKDPQVQAIYLQKKLEGKIKT